MLSIRPKWCEKIIRGEKTIEVRKTRPKLDTPLKCYIYCTKASVKYQTMAVLRHDLTCEQESSVHLASVCRWRSDHPWRNLWAWVKRKLGCAE